MQIIICGAGRVGQGIAQSLQSENGIVIVDEDPALVDRVTSMLDVRGVVGHAAHPRTLRNAGAQAADMIIAVTHSDEVNMTTCQIAHSVFGVQQKVARIRDQAYITEETEEKLFRAGHLPIDLCISPEIEVGNALLERLQTPGAFLTGSYGRGLVQLLGIEVDEKSALNETTIEDFRALFPELKAQIVGLGRGKNVFNASGETRMAVGDRVYWITPRTDVDHLFSILGNPQARNRSMHVIIVGAGNIGLFIAQKLEEQKHSKTKVRLIESDVPKAQKAAEKLHKTIVIQGDGLNPDLLLEAGVANADVVIGITNDDKTNLLLGAISKKLGAKKVMALVNDPDLANIRSNVGIDVLVDPRSITVSKILLTLRQGRFTNIQSIEDGRAEIVDGVARESSELVGLSLTKGELPEGMTAGALVRDDELIDLDEPVKAQDIVVLFAEKEMSRKVEQLYRVKPGFY